MPRSHALLIALCAAMMAHTSLAATLNGQLIHRSFFSGNSCTGTLISTIQYSNGCTYIPSQNVWARFGCSSDLVVGSTKAAMAVYASAGCTGTPTTVSDLGVTVGCSNKEYVICATTALAPAVGDLGKVSVAGGSACVAGSVLASGYIYDNSPICVDGTQVSCTNGVTTVQTFSSNTCSGTATSTTTGSCAAAVVGGTALSWSCTTYPPPTLNTQIPQSAWYSAQDCSGTPNAVVQYSTTNCINMGTNTWVRYGCSNNAIQGSSDPLAVEAAYSNAGCTGTAKLSTIKFSSYMGCAYGQKVTCENTAISPSASDVAKVSIFSDGGRCTTANALSSFYVKSNTPACVDGYKISCSGNMATLEEFSSFNCTGPAVKAANTSSCAVVVNGDFSFSCSAVPKTASGASSLLNNPHAQVLLVLVAIIASLLA